MKPAPFSYERPASVDAAIGRLAEPGSNAMAIAGAQSLLPMMALRVARPDILVDVSRLEDLERVRETATSVTFGAAITHAAIEDGAVPDPSNGLMPRVAGKIAYRAVRHHGTLSGSLALADPAADWPAAFLALSATVHIAGPTGTRSEPLDTFLRGAYTTTLAPGELIVAIEVPRKPALRWGAAKVTRKSGAFASSMAIVVLGETPRVVIGATSTRAQVLPNTSKLLAGKSPDMTELASVIAADIAIADPDADDYLKRAHAATVRRAIREATGP